MDQYTQPSTSTSEPSTSTSTTTGKKGGGAKRKKSINSSTQGQTTDNEDGSPGPNGNGKSKKPKIPRACDTCRRKKIRCNPIPDAEPMLCTYCSKHSLDCTWFLPISETRFKKQREKEEAEKQTIDARAAAVNLPTATSSVTLARQQQQQNDSPRIGQGNQTLPPPGAARQSSIDSNPGNHHHYQLPPPPSASTNATNHPYLSAQVQPPPSNHPYPSQPNSSSTLPNPPPPSSTSLPNPSGGGNGTVGLSAQSPQMMTSPEGLVAGAQPNTPTSISFHPRKEPRIVGYTSISHLMHSTSTFPTERIIPLDFKYSQILSVDERGDGFIRVISAGDGEPSGDGAPVAIQGIEHSDAEKLLNYFFTTHAAHFPIVSRADFLGTERPTALLFNCICAVSALSHHVAPAILRTLKSSIRSHLRSEDILDNSNIPNIQALLLYAFTGESEKGTAASKTWNILGLAIRMAQDLGLHRRLGTERKEQSEADHAELRRRVWGGCLIADRWMSAIYGQPMMIDLADCDALLPSVFDIRPNSDFNSDHRPYLFNSALISLSVLLGRILKAVYSPTGILMLSEKDGKALVSDLAAWVDGLPEELKFDGPEKSTPEQGFLHLLYLPVRFLITRPFMRISFQLPERFSSLSVGTQQWSVVESEAREAIEWVDKHESCLEGWFVGIYAFFICSLIQYHSHIRRRDSVSLSTLRLARDVLKRLVIVDGECFVRAKIAEIISLLYSTACSVSRWAPEAAEGLSPASVGTTAITTLNPTYGVRQREQDWRMTYRKDGGGYFVTDRRTNDPTGLIRSSQSPVSGGPSPRPHPSPYASSLRSTHLAGESDDPTNDTSIASNPESSHSSTILPPPSHPLGQNGNGTNFASISNMPASVSTAAPTASFVPPAPNPPPDLSFAFPDSSFDTLSFNPSLNLNGISVPGASSGGLGGTGGGSGGGGGGGFGNGGPNIPSMSSSNNNNNNITPPFSTMNSNDPFAGLEAFDPFGLSSDGTPSLFPDGNIFNLNAWESFASSLNMQNNLGGGEGTAQ